MVPPRLLELDLTACEESHAVPAPTGAAREAVRGPAWAGVKGGVSSSQIAGMGGRDSPRKLWVLSSQPLGLKPGQAVITDVSSGSSIPLLPPLL